MPAQTPPASARDLTAYLPDDVLAAVELHDAPAAWQALVGWSLPLPDQLPVAMRMAPLAIQLGIRSATGRSLSELLNVLAPSQVVAGWRPGERAPVVLTRIEDPVAVDRLLARDVFHGGGMHWGREGGVLLAAPTADRLATWRRRVRGGVPRDGLLRRASYRQHRPAPPAHGVRAFVDLSAVRRTLPARSLWRQLDAGGRLLVGPVAAAIDQATRVDWIAQVKDDRIAVTVTIDGSPVQTPAGAFLSPVSLAALPGSGARSLPALGEGALGLITLDRDLSAFFVRIEEIAPEEAVQTRAQLSMVSTLFGGASIEHEVIGSLRSPWTVQILPRASEVVVDRMRSELQLPSFVLSADLADPVAAHRLLHRGFGNFALVAGQQRRQQGKAPFRARRRRLGDASLRFVEWDDWDSAGSAPLEYELSPAWWVGKSRAYVGSTVDGVQRAHAAGARRAASAETVQGDLVRLFGPPVARWVRANAQFLALGAVLSDGLELREAKRRVDIAAAIAEQLELIELRFEPRARASRAILSLQRRRP